MYAASRSPVRFNTIGENTYEAKSFAAPAGSRDLRRQDSDALDLDLHDVAGLQGFAARGADAGRRAGQYQIAGMQGHAGGEMRDLFGDIKDHLASIGILFRDVVDPELDRQILRVGNVFGRHDPGTERTSAVEALLPDPVGLERGRFAHLRTARKVARREIVGDGVAGDVLKRVG